MYSCDLSHWARLESGGDMEHAVFCGTWVLDRRLGPDDRIRSGTYPPTALPDYSTTHANAPPSARYCAAHLKLETDNTPCQWKVAVPLRATLPRRRVAQV